MFWFFISRNSPTCVPQIPFVRGLIFKKKNNWNGLCTFSDQYLYPPTVDREGEEWWRVIIIIFAVYQFRNAGRQPISIVPALLVLNSISVPREQSGFGKEARYLTCYRQVSLYWPIFNAIITELFIGPAPFWCTSSPTRTPAWISLSFFLYVSLMCSTGRLTQLFPQDMNIKSLPVSLRAGPYSLLNALSSRRGTASRSTCFLPLRAFWWL